MKAVLLSVKPKWCERICHKIGEDKDGTPIYEKSIDVRKTRPRFDTPFKVYIYCTNGKPILGRCLNDNSLKETPETDFDNYNQDTLFRANGKVIGEFVCDEIIECCSEFYSEEEHPVFEALYRLSEEFDNCWECIASNDNDTLSKFLKETCLTLEDFREYLGNGEKEFYAWHISNLVIYDKPKELNEFERACPYNDECWKCKYYDGGSMYEPPCCNWEDFEIIRPPQSWCYVEKVEP